MPIFDPAIFDGSTGGLIFDDGGNVPVVPTPTRQTVYLNLAETTMQSNLAELTLSVNMEGAGN